MGATLHLFIQTEDSLEAVVETLNSQWGWNWTRCHDEWEEWYEAQSPMGLVSVGTHLFDDDGDCPMSQYQFAITWQGLQFGSTEGFEIWIEQEIVPLFQNLKDETSYGLMIVRNLQTKLKVHP